MRGITKRRHHGHNDPVLVDVMSRMGMDTIPFYDHRGEETKRLRRRWRELRETRDGPLAASQRPVSDAAAMTVEIKRMVRDMGTDAVGCAGLRPVMIDEGVDLPHSFVISFIISEDYAKTQEGPYAIEVEALSVYTKCSELADKLAREIRDMGWPALAHHNGGTEIQAVPAMYWSGLGEPGKHGSLIHPEFGASHRPGFVTTTLPLVEDGPMAFGVQDRCLICNLCESNCPGSAIGQTSVVTEGVRRWITNVADCYPYSRLRNEYCHICVDVCPYIHLANGDPVKKDLYKAYMRKRKQAGYRTPAWAPENEEEILAAKKRHQGPNV